VSTHDEGVEEDGGDEVESSLDQAQRGSDVGVVEVWAIGFIIALESIDQPDTIREDMLFEKRVHPQSASSTR